MLSFFLRIEKMSTDEKQLISNYQAGDEKALEQLIALHLQPIYRFIYRSIGRPEEASDLTQEVFVKLWKNIDRYNPDQNFKTWLYKIARNTAIDWLRKKKTLNFSHLEPADSAENFEATIPDPEPLPDKIFEQKELGVWLEKALDQIPTDYKTILLLHLNDQLTFEEIAEVVDKPMNTVKSQHRRALIALRKYLDNAPK